MSRCSSGGSASPRQAEEATARPGPYVLCHRKPTTNQGEVILGIDPWLISHHSIAMVDRFNGQVDTPRRDRGPQGCVVRCFRAQQASKSAPTLSSVAQCIAAHAYATTAFSSLFGSLLSSLYDGPTPALTHWFTTQPVLVNAPVKHSLAPLSLAF